jgi:hypothetical protein
MTKCKSIIFFTAIIFSGLSYAQVVIKEKDFTSKNVLVQIFEGEFQEETNAQKWPVSKTQALEFNSYLDANQNAYTIIDTILSARIDTVNVKIVVLKTMMVDSIGWIQDCMGCPPQIGLAYFIENKQGFELKSFHLNLLVNGHGFYIPKSRIEQIGPSKFAFVLTEEVMQDQGREYWFNMSNEFRGFLTYDYFSLIPSEQSSIIENSIQIVQTENEYFDLILNSKITPTEVFDTEKATKIKPVKTKLIYNNTDMMQHVQMPFGYSIQPK